MGVRRFNWPGFETLYLSLGWRTVFREVSGGFAHRPTPYVLVHHDVDCEGIADLLTEAARAAHGVSLADLSRARGHALIAGREPARA
jgi:RES domain-containing protein